jgi:Sulfotransferase family
MMRLIAGSGRSGTTWVQDAIASANKLRPVFEPLHPHMSEAGNRFAHRALAASDNQPELTQYLNDVCSARTLSLWTTFRQQRRWLFPPPERFQSMQDAGRAYRIWWKFIKDVPRLAVTASRSEPIIKCIRANLMLGWLSRRCDCRTVLVVRHPGAVIESELRGGWTAKFALERFRTDSRLREMTGGRYDALLERRLDPVQSLAARWVVENQWVIEQAAGNGVTVVYYERLRAQPESEWERIREALSLPFRPTASMLARPSQQSSRRRSAATLPSTSDPRWMRALSREQKDRIQGVLDSVGFSLYTVDSSDPRQGAAEVASRPPTEVAV